MAKVKIEEIVDHLSTEFKRALEDTLNEHFPGQRYDLHNVYLTFKRNIYKKCSTWEKVPDKYVEKDPQ